LDSCQELSLWKHWIPVKGAVSCFRAEAEETGVQPVLRVPLSPGRGLGAPVHQPAQQGRCLARGNIHNRVIFLFFVGNSMVADPDPNVNLFRNVDLSYTIVSHGMNATFLKL
jgi:hypothetical protein